jgi:hypothetical protein
MEANYKRIVKEIREEKMGSGGEDGPSPALDGSEKD